MHIEIGILPQDKLVMAAVAATGLLAVHAKPLLTNPANWLRTALAAVFFSILMQLWHLPVGPSELHLVGAIDPANGQVSRNIAVGTQPVALLLDAERNRLYVSNRDSGVSPSWPGWS